ncbi:hypothetical protein [Streptomyces sp. NPDC090021]|uniref:hypothetical protein n=1 Tax=Streptomyces sp. NPDC090021 TaxID=3365919 RepID=UPI003814F0FB
MLALTTVLRERQRRPGSPPPLSAGGAKDPDGYDGGGGGIGGGASGAGAGRGCGPRPDNGPGGGPMGCSDEDEEDGGLTTLAP